MIQLQADPSQAVATKAIEGVLFPLADTDMLAGEQFKQLVDDTMADFQLSASLSSTEVLLEASQPKVQAPLATKSAMHAADELLADIQTANTLAVSTKGKSFSSVNKEQPAMSVNADVLSQAVSVSEKTSLPDQSRMNLTSDEQSMTHNTVTFVNEAKEQQVASSAMNEHLKQQAMPVEAVVPVSYKVDDVQVDADIDTVEVKATIEDAVSMPYSSSDAEENVSKMVKPLPKAMVSAIANTENIQQIDEVAVVEEPNASSEYAFADTVDSEQTMSPVKPQIEEMDVNDSINQTEVVSEDELSSSSLAMEHVDVLTTLMQPVEHEQMSSALHVNTQAGISAEQLAEQANKEKVQYDVLNEAVDAQQQAVVFAEETLVADAQLATQAATHSLAQQQAQSAQTTTSMQQANSAMAAMQASVPNFAATQEHSKDAALQQAQMATQFSQAETDEITDEESSEFASILSTNSSNTSSTGQQQANLLNQTLNFRQPQWTQDVGQRIQMMMNKAMNSLEIRLDPAGLGAMKIRLNLDAEKQTHIVLSATSYMTREMLENAIPRLRDMLSQQGVELASVTVQEETAEEHSAEQGTAQQKNRGIAGMDTNEELTESGMVIKQGLVDQYV